MKINFNWGHGIALFYIVFAGVLVAVVIASRGIDHTLVVEDYYAHDLAYQKHYQKISNDLKSEHPVKIIHDNELESLQVVFESEQTIAKGVISFYRPSNKDKDFKKFFKEVPKNQLSISTKGMSSGRWKVMLDWEQGGKEFFKEIEIRV